MHEAEDRAEWLRKRRLPLGYSTWAVWSERLDLLLVYKRNADTGKIEWQAAVDDFVHAAQVAKQRESGTPYVKPPQREWTASHEGEEAPDWAPNELCLTPWNRKSAQRKIEKAWAKRDQT